MSFLSFFFSVVIQFFKLENQNSKLITSALIWCLLPIAGLVFGNPFFGGGRENQPKLWVVLLEDIRVSPLFLVRSFTPCFRMTRTPVRNHFSLTALLLESLGSFVCLLEVFYVENLNLVQR